MSTQCEYIVTSGRDDKHNRTRPPFYGLRTPNEAFFQRNPKLLGLGRQIGQINFWALVGDIFFGQFISTHFGAVSLLSMFSIIQSLFLQKTKLLYPHPKYLLGIGI